MMGYQSHLKRIEHLERGDEGGRCPVCGFGPDDPRTMYFTEAKPNPDGT
jgi:hypothetical protein